jgi:hypothetical protein
MKEFLILVLTLVLVTGKLYIKTSIEREKNDQLSFINRLVWNYKSVVTVAIELWGGRK